MQSFCLLGQKLYNVIVTPMNLIDVYNFCFRIPKAIKKSLENKKKETKTEKVSKKRKKYIKLKEKKDQFQLAKDNYINLKLHENSDTNLNIKDIEGMNIFYNYSGIIQSLLIYQGFKKFDFKYGNTDLSQNENTLKYKVIYKNKQVPESKDCLCPNWKLISMIWDDCIKYYLVDFSIFDSQKTPIYNYFVNGPLELYTNLKWHFLTKIKEIHLELKTIKAKKFSKYLTLQDKHIIIVDSKESLYNISTEDLYLHLLSGKKIREAPYLMLGELRFSKKKSD